MILNTSFCEPQGLDFGYPLLDFGENSPLKGSISRQFGGIKKKNSSNKSEKLGGHTLNIGS
ncbi:hypothetical protein AB6807_38215 [Variovorax sp. RCC_210]